MDLKLLIKAALMIRKSVHHAIETAVNRVKTADPELDQEAERLEIALLGTVRRFVGKYTKRFT